MAPKKRSRGTHVVGDGASPRDAKRMQRMLESMDVTGYEPNVGQQLLEYMHRESPSAAHSAARGAKSPFTRLRAPLCCARLARRAGTIVETLEDAVQYTEHAGRTEVSVEDTRLALAMVAQTGSVRRRPAPGLLREMAAVCNRRNLPEQRKQKQLPPPRDTFIHDGRLRNWQVVVPHRTARQAAPTYMPAPTPTPAPGAEARTGRLAAPRIAIRLSAPAQPPVQPAGGEEPQDRLNLEDALAMMQDPSVDYDNADIWDEEQPK